MPAQLAQSITDRQRPAMGGLMDRQAAGRSDSVTSFSELLQPADIAARLRASHSRQVALTETALFQRGVESSRPGDRVEREISQRRAEPAEPDRDSVNARTDGIGNTPNTNKPANVAGSEQELFVANPPAEAAADAPEIEPASSSPDEPDAKSAEATGAPTVPLTIPTFSSAAPPVASDWGSEADASAAATRAPRDPVVPGPADVAGPPRYDGSADSAAMPATVRAAGERPSSKPSSLLVPQAVLADAPEMAAAPSFSHTPSAASIATGPPGSELAGAAWQPPSPPGSARSPLASLAQAPSEPTAPPSPAAIAGISGAGDAGGGDLADAEQGFSSGADTHAPLAARAAGADRAPAIKPVAAQVALHIGKSAKAGLTRVEIALEPASLGRVEVRLDFGRDGSINALFMAETREALDALRADARTLERALSEAGVKTDSGSLGFSLREQGAGTGGRFSEVFARPDDRSGISAEAAPDTGPTSALENPALLPGERRLDIHA